MLSDSPTPFPVFIPHNPTEAQEVQLLHLTQNNSDSISGSILHATLYWPGSLQWKMKLYHWYNPILSSIHFTPLEVLLITLLWPELLFFGIFLIGYTTFYIFKGIFSCISLLYQRRGKDYVFLKLTFPTDTGKSAFATEQLFRQLHVLGKRQTSIKNFLHYKKQYSLEIYATKEDGITYIISIPKNEKSVITRNLLSYLPGLQIQEVPDYLARSLGKSHIVALAECKLAGHHALPLQEHKALIEHDPLSFLTGNMTKLKKDELISYQIITTPVVSSVHGKLVKEIRMLRHRIYKGKPLTPVLTTGVVKEFLSLPFISLIVFLLKAAVKILIFMLGFILEGISLFTSSQPRSSTAVISQPKIIPQEILNPYEQELATLVKGKIDQNQFESSVRFLVADNTDEEVDGRLNGLYATFGPLNNTFQALISKHNILPSRFIMKQRLEQFRKRLLPQNTIVNQNPILSASELSDLYHFPFVTTTRTEDMEKLLAHELPAPLSLKRGNSLDIIFANNTYGGGEDTPIGLPHEDRRRHMMVFGQTGSGKSTLLRSMIHQDIVQGNGCGVVDPHGQLAEEILVSIVAAHREKDLVWFNPDDLENLIAINIMETTPGLSKYDTLREKEFICESIISLFRKVFSDSFASNPHRIESIFRNTIYTAFTVEGATLFTIYDLLTDNEFRAKTVAKLTDERLQKFWKNLYGKAGSWQQIKMISPVTSRIERFLFSPSAKGILEKKHSTISFDDIMDNGKILVCNLSKGKLGEDTSQVLGLLILTKIQLTSLKRARIPEEKRRDFYLYVDEFQNFATLSFVQMLSEARKYHLNLIIAEQSTAQQKDTQITNILFANTGTVGVFKTASPRDEELILPLFSPYVKKGEIQNIPAYHFYMKIGATKPEEPFSGVTTPVEITVYPKTNEKMIALSNKKYAVKEEEMPEKEKEESKGKPPKQHTDTKTNKSLKKPKNTKKESKRPKKLLPES